LNEVDSERKTTQGQSQRIPGDLGRLANHGRHNTINQIEGAVLQDKRYPYVGRGAAGGTSLPAAIVSALPNGNVVDEARFVNRTKHPMRVSKLSACRTIERCWATI
jgi:hypothetical protein